MCRILFHVNFSFLKGSFIMELKNLLYEFGADKVAIISAEAVQYEPSFRNFCIQNACGQYGRSYACPPFAGEPEVLIAEAKTYKKAIVYQTISALEDSYDYEGMIEAGNRHNKIAQKMLDYCNDNGINNILSLTAGSCKICATCKAITNEPCLFPERIIPSIDTYCVNVTALAEASGMNYINGKDTVTYFGMLLLMD